MTSSLTPSPGRTDLMFGSLPSPSETHRQACVGPYAYFCSIYPRMPGNIIVKQTSAHTNHMKSSLGTSFLKATLQVVLFALCLSGPTGAQAESKDPLSLERVRPENLDDRTELPQGYLKVYSATDRFKDGDAWYFPHSSYAIYTIDGRLYENVRNHRSADDEVPEVVALPVGTYTVVARSERRGYAGMLVVIKEGKQVVLDLDLWETKTQRRA